MMKRTSSMNVVDVELDKDKESTEDQQKLNELEPEDLLWIEILKTLDKLEKGVEGDLSALGRATRNINRFRKRFPSTTWLRILYTIIPLNYRQEFLDLINLFIKDVPQQSIQLISNLAGVSSEDATNKLSENNNDVFKTLMVFIEEKEKLAKIEIKKKQQQLKKERLEREKKKGIVTTIEDDKDKDKGTEAESEKDKDAMDVDTEGDKEKKEGEESADDIKITLVPLKDRRQKRKFYPETYILLQLLIALELYDRDEFQLSLQILGRLIDFSKEQNRRTSDLLSSRLYQFYALCTQRLSKNNDLSSIRNYLFDNYQTACLQQNESAQSILIVLILQCYISTNLYSLAHKFVEKAEFPESSESQFFARYHYYRGRIDCVQLQYSDSLYHIQQSIRRAPQTGCYGFKIDSTRWLIVIQLLMGDIPDRNIFKPKFDGDKDRNNPILNDALLPFLEITECVREGDLNKYQLCLSKYNQLFIKCGLDKILLRLRHNVIKTGLRKINKSYSKISLKDIANKLGLTGGAKNAYFIVSKAIRDGVIDAKINYKQQFVESNENIDIYNTSQPYNNYAQRIKFCLEIRNNAVKNLRYPAKDDDDDEKSNKKAGDDDDERVTAEEIAEMIQKHFEEDDED